MSTIRVPIIEELMALSAQSAPGTPVTAPVTTDTIQFLSLDLNPKTENLIREDKGLRRTRFGLVKGGKQAAEFSLKSYLILAVGSNTTAVTAPQCENMLVGNLGATAVSYLDAVAASPSPTTTSFTVTTSAGTLKVGDSVSVEVSTGLWEIRPISAIATNALTFLIPFTVAPAAAAVVKSRIYRLSSIAYNYFTVFSWLCDTTGTVTGYARQGFDAMMGKLEVDFGQSIINLTVSGPCSQVNEVSVPAIPTLATNWITGFNAHSSTFGEFFIDTTQVFVYDAKLTIDNSAKQLPVPFGSAFSDGTILGQRMVSIDMTVDGDSANLSYLADAENKVPHAIFGHTGNADGDFFAFYCPKMNLALNDYKKDDITLRLDFSNSNIFGTQTDNEITICVA